MKRRSFLRLAGAFFVSVLIPGGKWLEASAATEAVATIPGPNTMITPELVSRESLLILEKNLGPGGLYSITLPAEEVKGGSSVTFEAGEAKGEINFHDAPGVKK